MPWKETNAMKEKKSFIDAMLRQTKPFRELCREFGISEKTGYKWRKRFLEQGYSGLEEESRAPQKRPNTIDGDTAAELIALPVGAVVIQHQTGCEPDAGDIQTDRALLFRKASGQLLGRKGAR